MAKANSKELREFLAVLRFELCLGRRKRGPERVVDQVENPLVACGVPQRVERPKRAYAFVEDAPTPLRFDILSRVAGERGDDSHSLFGEKTRGVFLAGLEEHGQVAAVDDLLSEASRAADQLSEMGVQLRRAAGQIDGLDAGTRRQEFEDPIDRAPRHDLASSGARFDMAVMTRLVAELPNVDLKDLGGVPGEGGEASARELGGKVGLGRQIHRLHHSKRRRRLGLADHGW